MNKFSRFAAVAALAATGMSAAHAELPASVKTAVDAAVVDVGSAGAMILGVVVAIAAVAWVRRVVR